MTTSGPKMTTPCVFPFRYKEKLYESCTSTDHIQNWCATKVGQNDTYVDDEWGNCNENCVFERKSRNK